MIIDAISDLHGFYPKLEGGDLLIVAGDLTARHTKREFYEFADWMRNQEYEDMVVIAGNHDTWISLEADSWDIDNWCDTGEFQFLCDSGTEFEGLKIWGSPWTLAFEGMNPKCKAFTCDTEEELYDKFIQIPKDIDILITHGPAYGILDTCFDYETGKTKNVGSKALYGFLKYVERPKLHVFGHIHEQYGKSEVFPTYNDKMMISVNCSHVNERYQPVNKPVRIIL